MSRVSWDDRDEPDDEIGSMQHCVPVAKPEVDDYSGFDRGGDEPATSLRPRPGETAEDTVARVVAAVTANPRFPS